MELNILVNLIASVGVVISIIFLAIQIRQNTKAIRASYYDSLTKTNLDFLKQLTENTEMAAVFEKGVKSWKNLNEKDKRTSNFLFIQLFRMWENMYYQNKLSTLESWLWESNKNTILSYYQNEGVKEWLQYRKQAFSKEFIDFVENNQPPERPIQLIEDL